MVIDESQKPSQKIKRAFDFHQTKHLIIKHFQETNNNFQTSLIIASQNYT